MAGRTVLITGASSGIGKATAKRLLKEGYSVYAAARRVEQMRDLEELGAIALKMDITNEEDVVAGVARINAEQGGTDILVNNAGFGLYGAMEDTPLDDARYQFEVNLFGAARLTQLVLPYMRDRGAGKIVNVSSVGGKIYTPLGSWYYATKHALEGWSDCLRWELKHFGIDVIIVEPGLIRTDFGNVMRGPLLEYSGDSAYGGRRRRGCASISRSPSFGSHTSRSRRILSHRGACRVTAERPTHQRRRASLDDTSGVALRCARDRIRAYDGPFGHGQSSSNWNLNVNVLD